MLTRSELEENGPPGFNLGQKEKDYVQHWALSFLARSGFTGVFKGGTSLQKAFALPRYSEDLEFTLNNAEPLDFEALASYLESAGFPGRPSWKTSETTNSSSTKLRVQGPLYNNKPLSECSLSFDFSKREKTALKPRPTAINPPYPDLMPYTILLLAEKEIVAEKIRAILTRESARDLYDLHYLVRRGGIPSLELVNEKTAFYNKEYSFAEFKGKVNELSKVWKTELAAFTSSEPDYELAKKAVLEAAKKIKGSKEKYPMERFKGLKKECDEP